MTVGGLLLCLGALGVLGINQPFWTPPPPKLPLRAPIPANRTELDHLEVLEHCFVPVNDTRIQVTHRGPRMVRFPTEFEGMDSTNHPALNRLVDHVLADNTALTFIPLGETGGA